MLELADEIVEGMKVELAFVRTLDDGAGLLIGGAESTESTPFSVGMTGTVLRRTIFGVELLISEATGTGSGGFGFGGAGASVKIYASESVINRYIFSNQN